MAVTLPTPTLTSPLVKTELDNNFSTLANKFGNITDADVSSSAAIGVTKLAAYYQEIVFTLQVLPPAVGSSWPAVGATTPLAFCGVPYTAATDEAWTVTDIAWVCTDTGTSAGQFEVRYGRYVGSTWTNYSTVTSSAITLANAAANNDANDGRQTGLSASLAVPSPIDPCHLVIVSAAVDAATLSAATSQLLVSVRARRKLQAA